jgi:hypothetical protein
MIKKIVAEPLVHFLLLALLLFALYALINPPAPDPNTITVSTGRVAQIKNNFVNRWKREPLPEELDNAIAHYVLSEIYLREARAIGMDRGDVVIDRRLRQKMGFMLEDLAAVKQPGQDELKQYYLDNIKNYVEPEKYSFQQVYLSADRNPQQLAAAIEKQTARMAQGLAPQSDVSMLPEQMTQASPAAIDKVFGKGFATQLSTVKTERWSEPLDSTFGQHFIYLLEHLPEQSKPYEQVADQLLRDWQYNHTQQLKQAFEKELLESYSVVIEATKTKDSAS